MIRRLTLGLASACAIALAMQACSDDPAPTTAPRDAAAPLDTGTDAPTGDAAAEAGPIFDAGACGAQASIGSAACTTCASDKCCTDLGACAKSDDCYKFASCESECKRTRPSRPSAVDGGDASIADAGSPDASADAGDAAPVITYDDECIAFLCRAPYAAGAALFDKLQQCLGSSCATECAPSAGDASDQ